MRIIVKIVYSVRVVLLIKSEETRKYERNPTVPEAIKAAIPI